MKNHPRRAFSLVELAVSLAVIAILVAILLPILGATKRSANAVACSSNLRQIGIAVQAYVVDESLLPYADIMPPPYTFGLPTSVPPLYELLDSYLPPSSDVYRCPGDTEVYTATAAASPVSRGLSYSYFGQPQNAAIPDLMWDYHGDSNHTLESLSHEGDGMSILRRDGSVYYASYGGT